MTYKPPRYRRLFFREDSRSPRARLFPSILASFVIGLSPCSQALATVIHQDEDLAAFYLVASDLNSDEPYEATGNGIENTATISGIDFLLRVNALSATGALTGACGNYILNNGALLSNAFGWANVVAADVGGLTTVQPVAVSGNYIDNEGVINAGRGVIYAVQENFSPSEGPIALSGNFVRNGSEAAMSAHRVSAVFNESTSQVLGKVLADNALENLGSINLVSNGAPEGSAFSGVYLYYWQETTENIVTTISDTKVLNAGAIHLADDGDSFGSGVFLSNDAFDAAGEAVTKVSGTRFSNMGSISGTGSGNAALYGVYLLNVSNATVEDTLLENASVHSGVTLYGVKGAGGPASVEGTTVINSGKVPTVFGVDYNTSTGYTGASVGVADTTVVNVGVVEGDLYGARISSGPVSGTMFVNSGEVHDVVVVRTVSSELTGVEIQENSAYLSGGKLASSLALVDVSDSTLEDVTFRNNKLYVAGDVDLSAATLTGVKAGYPSDDLADARKATGNELIFGESLKVALKEDGSLESLSPVALPFTGGAMLVDGVEGFNKITVKRSEWDSPIVITHLAAMAPESDTDNATVQIDVTNMAFTGVETLKAGDATEILKVTNLTGTMALTSEESVWTVGTTLSGSAVATLEDKTVKYTILERFAPEIQDQTHTVPMAVAAMAATLAQAGEVTSLAVHNLTRSGAQGRQIYAAAGGGAIRQKTGSHVSVRSFAVAAGIGNNIAIEGGTLSLGLGVEGGYGKFKNVFDAGEVDSYVNKRGRIHFGGFSFIGQWECADGLHLGAIVRAGRITNKQIGALYDASANATHDIRVSSNYIGGEFTLGKVTALSESSDVDLYAKYLVMYQNGDKRQFGASDTYDIEGFTSSRVRLGATWNFRASTNETWFAGAAYEREFDGKSKLRVDNGGVSAYARPAETDGGRAVVELGYKFAPEDKTGFHFETRLKGAYGHRVRSLWGQALFEYVF